MKGLISTLIVFMLMLFLVSCSSKSNTILTNILERSAQEFYDPMMLFSSYEPSTYIKDIDLATLVAGPDVPGYTPGDIYDEIQWDSKYPATFTAGVSISETVINDEKHNIPWYSWLAVQNGYYSYTSAEAMAVDPGAEEILNYNNPKCDSIYIPESEKQPWGIELAVCYEVVYDDTYPYEENQIGVTINTWSNLNTFPLSEPDQSRQWIFEIDMDYFQGRYPDVAYDTLSGDLYVVYTLYNKQNHIGTVNYQRYDRETGEWTEPFTVHGSIHDGWIPRIDIGKVYDLPAWPDEVVNTVVVVYSSFDEVFHEELWNPNLVYWGADESDGDKGQNGFTLFDSQFEDYNAGLPVVDIAQNSNDENDEDHKGAVVYVQQIDDDPNTYRVYEIDTYVYQRTEIIYNDDMSSFDPSICIHFNDDLTGMDNIASVSWFETFDTTGEVDKNFPTVCNILLDRDIEAENPERVGGFWQIVDIPVSGNWPSNLLRVSPGLSSAIISLGGYYWAGFCEKLIIEDDNIKDPPVPYVAYGKVDYTWD